MAGTPKQDVLEKTASNKQETFAVFDEFRIIFNGKIVEIGSAIAVEAGPKS